MERGTIESTLYCHSPRRVSGEATLFLARCDMLRLASAERASRPAHYCSSFVSCFFCAVFIEFLHCLQRFFFGLSCILLFFLSGFFRSIDEGALLCVRGGRGARGLLRRRGRPLRALRPRRARRQPPRRQALPPAPPLRRLQPTRRVRAKLRHMPGT